MGDRPSHIEEFVVTERKVQEVGWFQEIEVQFSYWHGGRRLKEGSTFCWPNDSVLQDAKREGAAICKSYGIDTSSSLEIAAFRIDREVARVRSPANDRHWQAPGNELGMPRNRLKSCRRIWSSKSGDAPLPQDWIEQRVKFDCTVPINGPAASSFDPYASFSVSLQPMEQEAMLKGFAVQNGDIQSLKLVPASGSGCATLNVSGEILIAQDPTANDLVNETVIDFLHKHFEVEIWPMTRGVHWDTSRLGQKEISWTLCR